MRSSSSTSQLSSTVNAPIEGWRAVLTVALRYRMVQRHQSNRRARQGREGAVDGSFQIVDVDMDMDMDGVEAMLEGVKTRGVSFTVHSSFAIANLFFLFGRVGKRSAEVSKRAFRIILIFCLDPARPPTSGSYAIVVYVLKL